MTEYTAMAVIVFLKSMVAMSAVLGAVWLAYCEKPGWGWMIFLAIVLGASSVRLGSDPEPSKTSTNIEQRT